MLSWRDRLTGSEVGAMAADEPSSTKSDAAPSDRPSNPPVDTSGDSSANDKPPAGGQNKPSESESKPSEGKSKFFPVDFEPGQSFGGILQYSIRRGPDENKEDDDGEKTDK
jgi:hypothetical protein